MSDITIRPVLTKADRKAFVDLPFRLYAHNPNWVPPLKDEVHGLITPGKNPWFEHGEAELFLAERGGQVVGRISAHIDHLALTQPVDQGMGPVGVHGLQCAGALGNGAGFIQDIGHRQRIQRAAFDGQGAVDRTDVVGLLQVDGWPVEVACMHLAQPVVDGGQEVQHAGADGVVGDVANVHL